MKRWHIMRCGVDSYLALFFFSSRRRHTRFDCDWSSDVCSSDLIYYRNLPSYVYNDLEDPEGAAMVTQLLSENEKQRQIQWDLLYDINRHATDTKIGRASCRERV